MPKSDQKMTKLNNTMLKNTEIGSKMDKTSSNITENEPKKDQNMTRNSKFKQRYTKHHQNRALSINITLFHKEQQQNYTVLGM
jgi:hypothetical protein